MTPVGDRVFVKAEEAEATTVGGILLPSSAQKRPTQGTVQSAGGAKAVTLYDADGSFLTHLDHGGFVTVIGNGLDRARTVARVGQDAPVTLARHENGRLTLTDPATGWNVELTAFGSDNEAAFAALLPGE